METRYQFKLISIVLLLTVVIHVIFFSLISTAVTCNHSHDQVGPLLEQKQELLNRKEFLQSQQQDTILYYPDQLDRFFQQELAIQKSIDSLNLEIDLIFESEK